MIKQEEYTLVMYQQQTQMASTIQLRTQFKMTIMGSLLWTASLENLGGQPMRV